MIEKKQWMKVSESQFIVKFVKMNQNDALYGTS